MTGIAPQAGGTGPGQERPTAAPGLAPDGPESAALRVVTAEPGQTVELPFTLAAATVSLRGDDLYLQVGDQLVVIKGYGPALDAGQPPVVLDPRGDTLALGMPHITTGTPVILTDAPELPPQAPADAASTPQHFGGALLTIFDPAAGSNLRTFHSVGSAGAESETGSGRAASGRAASGGAGELEFGGILLSRSSAAITTSSVIAPFEAKDDSGGVTRGDGSGNVLSGWGAAADLTTGGVVSKADGSGAPVNVTPVGVDVSGQYGTLHIAADGSAAYHRTVGGVADLTALPNGAADIFTYTLLNGDGRSDSATLTVRVMPETIVTGDTTGTEFDEALRFAVGASGALSGLGGEDRLFGGTGSDTLQGGADNDYLQPGSGNDKLDGGAGDDVLDLAGNLTAADTITGGSGNDALQLNGNYAAGVVFAADTLTEVERVQLAAGNSYKLTLADASNAVTLTVDGTALTAGNVLTLNGAAETSAALIANSGAGNDALTGGGGLDQLDGGAGNDTLTGNGGADVLIAGSGNDVLTGGAGNDRLVLAGNLTAADKIDGGADTDTLELDGNYAAGITFTATTMVNVETVSLSAGNSYKFTLNDANNTTGLTIDGTALAAGSILTVVGMAETSAALIAGGGAGNDALTGGAGKDTLSGGAGNDTLTGNNGDDTLVAGSGTDTLLGGNNNDTLDLGADLDATDKIDGGANTDMLKLDGDYAAGVTFTATTVTTVETISLAAGHDYKLKLADATNATALSVNGVALASGNALTLDGSLETASALTAVGGAGNDVLIGGAGSDTLTGGTGNDALTAGAGTDTLAGGAGDDILILGANLTAADKIDGGADTDIVKLQGNYAAALTLLATTIVNVEQIDLAAGTSYNLVLNNATAASALTIDGGTLATGQSVTVNGSAETSAALTLRGGAGNDTLTGGGGGDVLEGGSGNDTLTTGAGMDSVHGGDGNDTIVLAANLVADDAIDGGTGTDTVTLNGNYAAGIALAATTIVNVETITLTNGFSYKLILDDATNTAGLTVNGGALVAANALTLDGSAESSAALTASGGTGNDTLIGGGGDDSLTGGTGNDLLRAGAGTDTLSGGTGNDILDLGGNLTAADKIDGGANTDTLKLDGDYGAGLVMSATMVANVEAIQLATGHDYTLTLDNATNVAGLTVDAAALGPANHLILDGAAETTAALTALGGSGDDTLTGGVGNDLLQGGAGADQLTAGTGNDKLQGGAGDDVLVLGANLAATDQIDGGADTDTLRLSGNYAAGVVFTATTLTNVEKIELAAGGSYKFTLNDANNTSALAIDGAALLAGQVLTVIGTAETASSLLAIGGAGDDALTGGAGSDTLEGGAGKDTITAGAGTDVVDGGAGNDTIVLAANLTALDQIDGGADTDTVTLSGNYSAGVAFTATTVTNVETITLANGFSYKLTLDDATNTVGLTVNGSALVAANALYLDGSAESGAKLVASGGAGNDTLLGGTGDDSLTGGTGNDLLRAGAGTDVLLGGVGNDILELGGNLTAADQIDGGANTDTLKLDGDYASGVVLAATTVTNVEAIQLAAGHDYALTLDKATNVAGLSVDASALGAANHLILDGAAETTAALTAIGGGGDDTITGGAGNDLLQGAAGADQLTAGTGNDKLQGGAGDDVLVLGANLSATDQIDGGADSDTLKLNGTYAGLTFGATTLANVEKIELAAGGSYKFTLNDANNTSSLAIDGSALLAGQVLSVNGAAETASSLLLTGGAGDDALIGGAGSDTLKGGDGNDTLTTGTGNDIVDGGSGNDTIVLAANLTAADQIDGGAGNDTVTLSGNYSAGLVFSATTVTNVETITLAAGNSYKVTLDDASNSTGLTVNAGALAATAALTLDGSAETSAALTATGGAGNDTITGGAGNDTLTSGAGTDKLSGGAGNDTFVLAGNLTAADQIDGGADQDKLTLSGNYSAGIVFTATTLTNVEEIVLAAGNSYKFTLNDATDTGALAIDGSALLAAQVLTVNGAAETASSLLLTGGAGNDVLTGGAGSDMLTGGAGNDTLTTGAGNDAVDGGIGNDTIALGANFTALDKIDGGAGTDTVTLSGDYSAGVVFAATTLINVETLTLAAGSSYNLTLDDASNSTGLAVNASVLAASASLTLDGSAETSASLTATGGAGHDTITGGGGADKITSGAGIDTLVGGAGADTFVLAANLTAADKIDGGADLDTLSLSGNYAAGIVFAATTLTNVETVTLADGNSYKFTLHDATNAAGLSIDGSLLSATRTLTIIGTAETTESLTGTGGAGNDSLAGGGGADVLTGGAGNDALGGNAGTDLLFGGIGNDTLTGGAHADTFQFRLADIGKDTITDFKLLEGDVLEFTHVLDGAGSDIQDLIDAGVTAGGSGGNCVISWNGGTSTLTLTGVGGTVASVNDLATLLGPQLHVTH